MRSKRTLTRRELMLGASAALAISSCARRPASPRPLVSIVRHPAYDQGLYDSVRRLLLDHKLNVRGKRVVLKPNLVEFDSATTINTHPLLVHAALEAFRSLGAAEVRIAEGPGHRRITLDLADAAGYFQIVPSFDGVFTDLNLDEITPRRLKRPVSKLRTVYFPNTVLGCDLLVSMPKLKTHHWAGATLSMKNLFGLLPGGVYGWPKNILHWAGINESIADLYAAFPNTFALVDGIDGMEGNGPIQGTPKHAGVLVAGDNLPAVDATCCRIMGIDPLRIGYLRMSAGAEALAEHNINQAAEAPRAVRTDFQLLPGFQSIRLGGA
ncbi:MAG TPA: DUF362 domain-containing protein [Bryobacteraceae bacterium]|nr:DUF362 domain-containing protein [Bryobacteraceae bacterium]